MCSSRLCRSGLLLALLIICPAANAQVVFNNDFESNTDGFSDSGSLMSIPLTRVTLPTDAGGPSSPINSKWLGKLGDGIAKGGADEIVTLPLSGLIPGNNYSVSFDLLIGASWDGAAGGYGPDAWRFSVNGTRLIDTIFSNVQAGVDAGAYSPQRYTDTQYTNPNGPDVPRFSGAEASYYTVPGYADDYAIYYMGHGAGNPILNFQATATTATLEFARYGTSVDSSDEYWALDNVLVTGTSTSPGIPGDYNNNGRVDSADYVLWRNNQGTNNALPNDPLGGTIDIAQFNQWRSHFGQTAGSSSSLGANSSASSASIPEPSTAGFLMFAGLALCTRSSRRVRPTNLHCPA